MFVCTGGNNPSFGGRLKMGISVNYGEGLSFGLSAMALAEAESQLKYPGKR